MLDFSQLSLDDIIASAKRRKNNSFGPKRGVKPSNRILRPGINQRQNFPNRRAQSNRIQQNVFEHSNEVCVAHVSNLGPLVTTSDLQELFSGHPFIDVAVRYKEAGTSTGTAMVIFKNMDDGMNFKRDFKGVMLDDREMNIFVSSGAGRPFRFNGVKTRRNVKRPARTPRNFAPLTNSGQNGREQDKWGKGTVSAEELDRDLDLYMRGGHPKITAP